MVRSISPASQAKLDQNFGTEPAIIIEIQWVDGGSIYTYSDKDLGAGEGKILDVSGLDNTVVIQGVQGGTSSDSQQISVTLDDTDGTIKEIIDSHDIHKEPAWVYQWFQGLDTSEKFLVFKGQISSPMQWNEGDRTVSFDIITRIEDAEVGFSMEEGNFDYVPEDLVGEPWPLIFGTVRDCPALKTRSPRKGLLKTGFGIRDYMLAPKKEQAENVCCPWRFVGFRSYYESSASGGPWGAGPLVIEPVYEKDVNCICKQRAVICEMDLNISQQAQFEYSTIEIVDGIYFPQGVFIVLDISGAKVSGSFNGTAENPSNIFTIANRRHPKLVEGNPTVPPIEKFGCDPVPDGSESSGAQSGIGTQTCILPPECGGWGSSFFYNNIVEDNGGSLEQKAWNYLSQFQEAGFFWAEPGSEVLLDGDNELVYIANLLPSTIHTVKAWRTFSASNLRQLTTVPNSYYTTRQSDFGEYTTTEVVFDRPLSSRGQGWEDDIFVSLTSSVGPNPVDIMEWLITKYTSFTWDSSFATIKTKIDKYPMNFMVPGRPNVFDLLKDMAFQGRLALVLRNDQFRLIYLSEEPANDGEIAESDVIQNSLVLDHSNTEDLVTKLVCEWRPQCFLEEPYRVILRYNGKRYGTHEETFDFYCYNIQELVIKSGTFWMIRMANTWRKIICQTPINKLALESLDGVYVTLPDIANGQIKCRVETATYNSDNHSIDFVVQTPVRSGERDPFPFHYPADISIELLHPTIDDIQFGNAGGGGPGVDVEAPEGHVLGQPRKLAQGFSFGQKSPCDSLSGDTVFNRPIDIHNDCRPDQGDQQPSDTDDQKPTVPLDEDNSVIPPEQSPVNEQTSADIDGDRRDLQQEGRDGDLGGQITNNTNTGTGSTDGAGSNDGAGTGGGESTGSEELKDALDDMPDPDDLTNCHYDVQIFYLNPVTSVRIPNGETCDNGQGPKPCNSGLGWCYCKEIGKSGCWVGNQVPKLNETFAFDTAAARDDFADSINGIIAGPGTNGQIHPAFLVKHGAQPPGCEPFPNANGSIVGYRGTGQFEDDGQGGQKEKSVIGLDGFTDEGWTPPAACTV
jgi:hypothetical protein